MALKPKTESLSIKHTGQKIKPKDSEAAPPIDKMAKAKKRLNRSRVDPVEAEELIENLPVASTQERKHLDEYIHMFRRLQKLIRKLERTCLTSCNSKDIYALATLYSQQREVIADIRSVSDMSAQVGMMDERVLQPLVRSLAQNMLDSFYQKRKLLMETAKPGDTQFALSKLDEITKDQGKYLQHMYADAMGKVQTILLG